jgi:hypothetical protein
VKYLYNTIVVLAVTVLAAAGVYAGVTALGGTAGADELVSSMYGTSDSVVQTCPATGCTSVGCHASTGGSALPGTGSYGGPTGESTTGGVSRGRGGHGYWGAMPPAAWDEAPQADLLDDDWEIHDDEAQSL